MDHDVVIQHKCMQHGNTFYSVSSKVCSNLFIAYDLFSSHGYKNTFWQTFQRNFSIWTLSQPCQPDRQPNNTHQSETKSRLPQTTNWSGLVGTTHQLWSCKNHVDCKLCLLDFNAQGVFFDTHLHYVRTGRGWDYKFCSLNSVPVMSTMQKLCK